MSPNFFTIPIIMVRMVFLLELCYLWQTNLVWLHILSDSLIALAYYSIPAIALTAFARNDGQEYRRVHLYQVSLITYNFCYNPAKATVLLP